MKLIHKPHTGANNPQILNNLNNNIMKKTISYSETNLIANCIVKSIDRKEISIQDYDNVQAYFWASNEVQMIDEYTIHGGDWLFHRGLIKDVEVEVYYDEDKVVGRSVDLIRETEVEDE